ncbi:DUF2948 family protein [Mycoplana dimorpha]|uniref:DUF2948 family protein n=1 Tax=Mycoplana dimorpha TaxID=28320 RepID=A0A2T5BFK1_MYCDI|nr:DUF2948 family protein [Mycoplana dimorpha]PTM97663.1 hypothetical protein C7449_102541 [Mycoplana dimorpha]
MDSLKLMALDADDLAVVSAHLQDAVFKVGDITWDARHGVFTIALNRFVWEKAAEGRKGFQRRRTLVAFKRVQAVRSIGIDQSNHDAVLCLLAIRFTPKEDGPDGTIELLMSGAASIALDVECIESQLADTGATWETGLKPSHPAG